MTVEKTTKYATTVATIQEAFTFVMEKMDEVGENPRIIISPFYIINDDDSTQREFEVSVSGMVEE